MDIQNQGQPFAFIGRRDIQQGATSSRGTTGQNVSEETDIATLKERCYRGFVDTVVYGVFPELRNISPDARAAVLTPTVLQSVAALNIDLAVMFDQVWDNHFQSLIQTHGKRATG